MRQRLSAAPTRCGPGDPTAAAVIRLDTLLNRWRRLAGEYAARALGVELAIQSVADPDIRRILRLYDMDGLGWETVAETVHYSVRQTQRLRDKGLRELGVAG
jgi:hypothetical protein